MVRVSVVGINGSMVLENAVCSPTDTFKTLRSILVRTLECKEFKLVCSRGLECMDTMIMGQEADGHVFTVVKFKLPNIFSNRHAFAAIKGDGSVFTWGDDLYGGGSDAVREQLAVGVHHIYSSDSTFAAVKVDGAVVTWGNKESGGNLDVVREQVAADVEHIYSNHQAFAAVKSEGRVVTWGKGECGGNCDAVQEQLATDVQQI